MAREADKFRIGLFVISATVISVALIIWLGASKFFKSFDTYVTYFDESVSGLNLGASVALRGVPVGTVKEIDIAPDNRLIEVVFEIESGTVIPENYFTMLERQGFTGQRTININSLSGLAELECPNPTFEPEYPYVQAYPSGTVQLDVALNRIYGIVTDIDTKGLSDGIKQTLAVIDSTLYRSRIDEVLHSIEAQTVASMQNMNRVLTKLEQIDIEGANDRTSRLLEQYCEVADSLKMIAPQMNYMVNDFRFMMQTMQVDVNRSLQSITESMQSAKNFFDYIETNPSSILRGRKIKEDIK